VAPGVERISRTQSITSVIQEASSFVGLDAVAVNEHERPPRRTRSVAPGTINGDERRP